MTTNKCATIAIALLAVLGTAASAFQAPAPAPTAKSKAMASLQGAWLMTSADGQDLTGSGQEIIVTITEDKYVQTVNGETVERGSFKIDETKKPMTLDVLIAEGQDAGQTQLGVIEIDGKTMYGKLAQPGATTRPTDFQPGEGFFTFVASKR